MGRFNYERAIFGERQQFLRHDKNLGGIRLDRSLEALGQVALADEWLLEVGCGAGVFSRSLKHYYPDARVLGCDLSQRAVMLARQQSQGILYNVADAQGLPYMDAKFQAVVFFDLLEHVEAPDQTLQEFHRVLKPGGILHGYVPCEGNRSTLHWLMRKIGIGANLTRKHAGHINYFSEQDLVALARNAGFTVEPLSHSAQFLGQMLDVTMFVAREIIDRSTRPKAQRDANSPAKFHNRQSVQSRGLRALYDPLRCLVDSLVFWEAHWFRHTSWGLGVHLTAQKRSEAA
jgi:SAM-dependent methyltransferase